MQQLLTPVMIRLNHKMFKETWFQLLNSKMNPINICSEMKQQASESLTLDKIHIAWLLKLLTTVACRLHNPKTLISNYLC